MSTGSITANKFFEGLPVSQSMHDALISAYTASVGKTYEVERARARAEDEKKAKNIQFWEHVHDVLRTNLPALYPYVNTKTWPQDQPLQKGWNMSVEFLIPGCAPITATIHHHPEAGIVIEEWVRVGYLRPHDLHLTGNVPNVIVAARLVELCKDGPTSLLDHDEYMVWEAA